MVKWTLSGFLFILIWFYSSLFNLHTVYRLGFLAWQGEILKLLLLIQLTDTFLCDISQALASNLVNERCLTSAWWNHILSRKAPILTMLRLSFWKFDNVIKNDTPTNFSLSEFFQGVNWLSDISGWVFPSKIKLNMIKLNPSSLHPQKFCPLLNIFFSSIHLWMYLLRVYQFNFWHC